MSTTIKVHKETVRRLNQLMGKLVAQSGQKMSKDDLINFLLNAYEQQTSSKKQSSESDPGTLLLKQLLKTKFSGAGPEDFKEYSYEDL